MGADRRPAHRRRQFVRLQRHQCARRGRGGAGGARPSPARRAGITCSCCRRVTPLRWRPWRAATCEAFASLDDRALPDVCFTAAAGRAHLPQRAVMSATSMEELRERLAALAEGQVVEGLRTARVGRRDPARIAFLFTGQGAQYAGMARQLDAREPVFRAALDRCAEVLDARLPRPLREVLFSTEAGLRRSTRPVTRNPRCLRSSTRWPNCGARGACSPTC